METEVITKENYDANEYYSIFHLFSFSQFHASFVMFRENNSVTWQGENRTTQTIIESRQIGRKKRKWNYKFKENLISLLTTVIMSK